MTEKEKRTKCAELWHAVYTNDYSQVEKLLLEGEGMPVHFYNNSTALITPLYVAASNGNAEIVKLLLQYGAEVNCVDRLGRTALHVSIYKGYVDVIEALIEKGVDLEKALPNGDTPLHIAVTMKHNDVTRLLVNKLKEGSLYKEDAEKVTPYQVAMDPEGNDQIKSFFKSINATLQVISEKTPFFHHKPQDSKSLEYKTG
ncbi:ankyrin repeat domain-containing protein [Thiotrichales bacterium 19S9-12]|nr:ankyrin repeat domain-containing protein [Thiotrichales bacterium 19S9-11]MCF6811193.1 ankyrin repeat domain-containing protein [Thiotrichales bacterium 19S9-12]